MLLMKLFAESIYFLEIIFITATSVISKQYSQCFNKDDSYCRPGITSSLCMYWFVIS